LRLLAALIGLAALTLVLVDAFNTIVLARRTRHIVRIARFYYKGTWKPFSALGRRIRSSGKREAFLAVFAPLSLLTLFAIWAFAMVFSFGLLQWGLELRKGGVVESLSGDFLLSASALFSLSTGDPENVVSRWIAVLEGGLGLAFLGLVVAYLPMFYQSFSTRELTIALLDARAGSPPSAGAMLNATSTDAHQIIQQLEAWEQWASSVLENHLSYPMLAWFRSHHPNQSWLTALVSIVDCAAVVILCAQGETRRQAEFTFAMGRHVLTDMAALFGLEKNFEAHRQDGEERLSSTDVAGLVKILGSRPEFDAAQLTEDRLRGESRLYEAEAAALGDYFLMTLPSWFPIKGSRSDWRASVTDREDIPVSVSDPFHDKQDGDKPSDRAADSKRYEVERGPLPDPGGRR
jgi:hypothetical protein